MKTVAIMRGMTPEKIAELRQAVKEEQEIYSEEWNEKIDRLKRDRNALFRMRSVIRKICEITLTAAQVDLKSLQEIIESRRSLNCFTFELSGETAEGITLTITVLEAYFEFMKGGKKALAWILRTPTTHEDVAKRIERLAVRRFTNSYTFNIISEET